MARGAAMACGAVVVPAAGLPGLLAFSTIIGWNFYGEQCLRYLTGGSQRAQRLYRWCYLAALCTAPLLSVKAAWELADILNACMALPNLTALLLLWRQVVEGSRRPAGKT